MRFEPIEPRKVFQMLYEKLAGTEKCDTYLFWVESANDDFFHLKVIILVKILVILVVIIRSLAFAFHDLFEHCCSFGIIFRHLFIVVLTFILAILCCVCLCDRLGDV